MLQGSRLWMEEVQVTKKCHFPRILAIMLECNNQKYFEKLGVNDTV